MTQEGCRKDVECVFGVLQSRFNIVHHPTQLWKQKSIGRIMTACVIIHNTIVEDEKEMVK
uniref:DDE Tnp4 domain-containing protein n=1 Tax=Arundo donax TaxID=35708 RepID=A0A0A9GR26_ARUDO